MIYVFIGNVINIINSKINNLINDEKISNVINYDFKEYNLNSILTEINYVDLFNERKLVIVDNFSFKKLKSEDEESLIKYISNMNDNIIVFKCIDEELDGRKKLTKEIKEKCRVVECKKLDFYALHDYLDNMFKESNMNISFEAINKIINMCETNTDIAINEANKLILYKGEDKNITDTDILNVISSSHEKEMFNFVESLLKKDLSSSLNSLKILINNNVDYTIIVDAIGKQYRLLYQVKLSLPGSDEELGRKFDVNPYTIKKIIPYVNAYNEIEIANILLLISKLDKDIKSNSNDKTKIIENFIIQLLYINN